MRTAFIRFIDDIEIALHNIAYVVLTSDEEGYPGRRAKVVFADDAEEWYDGVASCIEEGENVADVATELL